MPGVGIKRELGFAACGFQGCDNRLVVLDRSGVIFRSMKDPGRQVLDLGRGLEIRPAANRRNRSKSLRLSVGVINATDAYPDKIAQRALLQGGSLMYSEAGGLGSDGREYYARIWAGF